MMKREKLPNCYIFRPTVLITLGYAVAQLVKALPYKPAGSVFGIFH